MEHKLYYADVVYRNELYKVYWNTETRNALVEKDTNNMSPATRPGGVNPNDSRDKQPPVNTYSAMDTTY